jgi:hypothetical protein
MLVTAYLQSLAQNLARFAKHLPRQGVKASLQLPRKKKDVYDYKKP